MIGTTTTCKSVIVEVIELARQDNYLSNDIISLLLDLQKLSKEDYDIAINVINEARITR